MRQTVPLLLLLLLFGCKMGPNYRRPEVVVPCYYRYQTEPAYGSLQSKWWKEFDDTVLDCLVEQALAHNKDVRIAAANIKAAAGLLVETRAQLFPQIGYTGSYDRLRESDTLATSGLSTILPVGLPNPQTTWQALLSGSWEIDFWGRIRRLAEAAEAGLFSSYKGRQEVILTLVASVANSYLELRGLDEQLAIAEKTKASYAEEVRYFELQFQYGQKSEMEVAQARTQYEGAAARIPPIKTQIAETENALSILLGKNPGPIPRGKTIYELRLPDIPEGIPSEILTQRPDIQQAEQQLIAANAEIGAAQALYFPSISLTGFYGGASQNLDRLFNGPSRTWNFIGQSTGPIFTAGSIYGQVVQAKAQREAALYNYQKTIQSAFAEVENSLVAHSMLVRQLSSEKELVKAAGEYKRLATLQFDGGYSPYFVVIQAQEQYFPAQLQWAQTRAQLFTSIVDIYRAMGGGWVTAAQRSADGCNKKF